MHIKLQFKKHIISPKKIKIVCSLGPLSSLTWPACFGVISPMTEDSFLPQLISDMSGIERVAVDMTPVSLLIAFAID